MIKNSESIFSLPKSYDNQEMHIVIPVLHRPEKPTGVCRHAANLAQCLIDTELVRQVTLVIGRWQQAYFKSLFKLESSKIQLVAVDIKNTSFSRNQWFIFGLPKLVNRFQPDLIHMSFPFPFVQQWLKAPVVSTIHDLYPYEFPENFGYPQVWFNKLFLRQCVHNSDGLVCVSKCTLGNLEEYFPKIRENKQTRVIYNVVDLADIEPKYPSQLGKDFSSRFLLTVAQHRKNKNLDLLIRAYDTLRHDSRLDPKTLLLAVGSHGPETEHLRHLVQSRQLEDHVLFLSGLEDGELRWLYEHAALFVMPSSTEGFCLPLVEALTSSCPVVCSDIPIFREVGALRCRYFQLDHDAQANLVSAIASELTSGSIREKSEDLRFCRKEVSQHLLNFYARFGNNHAILHNSNL